MSIWRFWTPAVVAAVAVRRAFITDDASISINETASASLSITETQDASISIKETDDATP